MNSPHGSARRARRLSPRRFYAVLGAVLAGVACMDATQAQMQTNEVQVKVAFIHNFALFTNWSTDVMQTNAPMVVCVTTQHPLQVALEKLTGKPVCGHHLEIRKVNNSTVASCHVLVFDTRASSGVRVDPVTPVPMVSDSPKSTCASGVLEPVVVLMLHDSRVVFDIDAVAMRQTRLQISSQLLRLARSV